MASTDEDDDELETMSEEELETRRKRSRRLSTAEWERCKALWRSGNVTLRELADMFGIRQEGLHRRLKKHKVEKGSALKKITEEIENQSKEETEIILRRIAETKETHYQYSEILAKLVMKQVVEAQQGRIPFAQKDGDLAALYKASKTLSILRDERYRVLGLDKEGDGNPDEKEELLVSELTEQQIKDLSNAQQNPEMDPLEGMDDVNVDIDLSEEEDEDIVIE